MTPEKLIEVAKKAREKAYAPYSGFKVGAAVLGTGGTVYTGCNVENASLGLTVCAERVALFKAVSEGEKSFQALAVFAATPGLCTPCGACRQVLLEFSRDIKVYMANGKGDYKVMTAGELVPFGFELNADDNANAGGEADARAGHRRV